MGHKRPREIDDMSWARTTAFGIIALGIGCGGATANDEEEFAVGATAGGGETSASADVVWADMNQEQRFEFMQNTVVPEMQALFQETDPERYSDFGCATCHGEGAQEVGFSMPNGIAPLRHEDLGAIFQSEEPMAQLMAQRVWPRMAELLSEEPFDPETGAGFSCMRCHATAEGGAAEEESP